MALENPKSSPETLPLSQTLEQVPDSSPLRVSLNTQFESGIPPARLREDREITTTHDRELRLDDGMARMESVLSNVTRTEANLGHLIRGLKHLAAGALSAREANTELIHELDELRVHLAHSHEVEESMRFRMNHLEQLLNLIRHESARERSFLIEQQDLFLVSVFDDHERQLNDLRAQLVEATARQTDAQKIAELTAQRDQAREYATRCERERDLAWHELATGEAPPVTVRRHPTPPPLRSEPHASPSTLAPLGSRPGAAAIGSVSLRAVPASTPAAAPPPAPEAADTEHSSERLATGYSLSGRDLSE